MRLSVGVFVACGIAAVVCFVVTSMNVGRFLRTECLYASLQDCTSAHRLSCGAAEASSSNDCEDFAVRRAPCHCSACAKCMDSGRPGEAAMLCPKGVEAKRSICLARFETTLNVQQQQE